MMLFIWPLLAALSFAENVLETSALLSCQDNSQVQASSFNLQFYQSNNTAEISTNIVSSIEGNFSADIKVVVYGIPIYTRTITNCEIADTICPMTAGHFNIDTKYTIGKDVIKDIPGIAFTMPDIDAVVRVEVYQLDLNGNRGSSGIACVEAQVTNNKTVQTPIASWVVFGLIMFFLFIAGIMGLRGYYSTATHITSDIMSLFGYFQAVAMISMMAVERLPPISAAWAQNFMWTMGIMRAGFMQKVMSWYIRSTGGTPSTIIANKQLLSIAVYRRALETFSPSLDKLVRLLQRVPQAAATVPLVGRALASRAITTDGDYATTNELDPNILQKTLVLQGIKRVAFKAEIEISNLFLTAVVFFLFIGLVLVFLLALIKFFLETLCKSGILKADRFLDYRQQWLHCIKGVMNRYFLVAFSMLTTLCLYEFTVRNSVACVIDAAVIYAVVLISLVWSAIKVIMLARESTKLFKNPAYILYGNSEILNHWGFMYVSFRATAYYFLVPMLLANFTRGAVIALGQSNGKVQAVLIFAVELIYLILTCAIRPYMDKKTNGINIAVAVIMFLNSVFFMLFSQIFPKTEVASPIAAVVFFIVNAVFSLVLIISIIVSCLWAIFRKDPDSRYQPMKDDRAAFRHDARDAEPNELAEMGDAARDGYRESFRRDSDSIYREPSSGSLTPQHVDNAHANYRPYGGYHKY